MPSRRDEVAVLCALHFVLKKRKKRSLWSKNWLLARLQCNHTDLLEELRLYPADFRNFLRMDEGVYLELLGVLSPMIEKEDTRLRKSISAHERLTATLRFIATGCSYEDLKFSTRISPQALGQIIPETCRQIFEALKHDYMRFPSTELEWTKIGKEFENKWQFPNCLGCVDGKHIAITPPPHSGSYYYNYKGFHSMVLLGVANANYEFLYVNFGTNGRISDGGVIENTDFFHKLLAGELKLPELNPENGLPFVFVSDEAFTLRKDFLKPYHARFLNDYRRIFNYRLSRARRVIENVFGILVARFRVLKSCINVKPENIDKIVMACCVLHNYLRRKSSGYLPPEAVDCEDLETCRLTEGLRSGNTNVADIRSNQNRYTSEEAKAVRDSFLEYFNNAGSVPWKHKVL